MHRIVIGILSGCIASNAILVSSAFSAHAQTIDKNGMIQLRPVVIDRDDLPAGSASAVLSERHDAEAIQKKQIDDVHDVSRLDPVITYNARNDSFTIRGLDSNRILTSIDGIRVPWLDDGARGVKGGASTFDFNALSALDITRGSDSSLYGSGALGGVVALRTLEPEDLLTQEKNWGSLTKGSYDSADGSWHVNQAFAMRAGQTYALFHGGYATGKQRRNNGSGGGYGPGRILENPADYDQNNLMFKIYQHVDNSHRFGLTAERFYYDKDVSTLNASVRTYRPGSAANEENRQRERLSLSYDYDGHGGALDEAHAILYWQRQRLEQGVRRWQLSVPKGNYVRDNRMRDTGYGVILNGVKQLDLKDVRHTIRFSTDLSAGRFHQYADGEDSCPPPPYWGPLMGCAFLHTNHSDAPDTNRSAAGLAVEDEIGFLDSRLRITPGARFDWYEYKLEASSGYERNPGFAGYPHSSRQSRLSPKIRAEWDAGRQVTLYAQWAQGFWAPSVTELYLDYVSPNLYYSRGNPDLRPETSNGYDIGARLGDERLGGAVSLFTNRYQDFIDVMDLGPSAEFPLGRRQYFNHSRVHISGLELIGHWVLENGWHTNLGFAFAEGKDTGRKEYLNSVAPLKGVASIGYDQQEWGADFTMTAVARRSKVARNAGFATAPGYAVFDLSGWWTPFGAKGPRLQAGVYNLFNKRYWNAVDLPSSSTLDKDYFSEPGRSFKFSIVQKL